MTETMDEIDYAFFLAYGMTSEDEELSSLLDVEMYTTVYGDEAVRNEARDSTVLT